MWKGINLLILLCAAWSLQAQKTAIPTGIEGFRPLSAEKSVTDTLDGFFDNATPTLYASPNGGFMSGNTGYNELGKIQEFEVEPDSGYAVEGFIYWFGYKHMESQPDDSSAITLVLYDMDSSSTINGVSRRVPKTLLDTHNVLLSALDTSQDFSQAMTIWMLPTPRTVNRNYSPGIRFEDLYFKDTVALYTSTDGDAPETGLSWELWQGVWNTIDFNWGVDVDFAIFPLVDLATLGFQELPGSSGLQVMVYPNPATQGIQVEADIQNEENLGLQIISATGEVLKTIPWPVQPGRNQLYIDMSGLAAGNYFICFSGESGKAYGASRLVLQ